MTMTGKQSAGSASSAAQRLWTKVAAITRRQMTVPIATARERSSSRATAADARSGRRRGEHELEGTVEMAEVRHQSQPVGMGRRDQRELPVGKEERDREQDAGGGQRDGGRQVAAPLRGRDGAVVVARRVRRGHPGRVVAAIRERDLP